MKIDIEKIKKGKSTQELINFGIINIDKPSGPTSYRVDDYIKKSLDLKKSSHAGTLDPKVTGVQAVLLGRACKLLGYFIGSDKTYVGVIRIHKTVSIEQVKEEAKKLVGKIKQLPPLRSSVKRAIREREVHSLEILEGDGKNFVFVTKVQAGTYARRLCEDLGKNLGEAHMLELRRVQAGLFGEKESHTLYDFDKAVSEWRECNEEPLRDMIIPAEIIAEKLPPLLIKEEYEKILRTGKILLKEHLAQGTLKKEEVYSAFINKEIPEFLGIYQGQSEKSARAKFVFN